MKFSPVTTAACLVLFASATSFAQIKAPEPDYTLTYNVGAVSDYRYRGISQTSFKPALQLGVDFAHKSGFYLGAFGSNVDWVKQFNGATKGSYEIDLYGGFKGSVTSDIGFDVGLISYQYPGNNSGVANASKNIVAGAYSNANTNEVYLGLSYSVVSLKYSRSIGDFLGNVNSSGSQYVDLTANFDLGNGFTLTPHVGRQTIPNSNNTNGITGQVINGSAGNYTDYSLAIAKDFGNGLVGTAAAIGTNTKKGGFYRDSNLRDLGKSTLVVGVKYTF